MRGEVLVTFLFSWLSPRRIGAIHMFDGLLYRFLHVCQFSNELALRATDYLPFFKKSKIDLAAISASPRFDLIIAALDPTRLRIGNAKCGSRRIGTALSISAITP